MDLINQIFVYGIAGAAGLAITVLVVAYAILAVRKAVAKVRRLLGRLSGAVGFTTASEGAKAHAGR